MADGHTIQVKVRMPMAFHRILMREAGRSGQTLNAVILRRLQGSLASDETLENVSDTVDEVLNVQVALKKGLADIRAKLDSLPWPTEAEIRERADRLRSSISKSTDKT
jgi:hypothetical protein